ncbi:aldo/keto reductase [Rhodopseudomonas parapalustris]
MVGTIKRLAAAKGCAPAQLAIAWLLHQSNRIIPIPRTRRIATLDEHLGAAEVTLSAQDLSAIRDALPPGTAVGARYPESAQTGLNG